ncbi:MAG: glucose 1-dehydrogenase [Saprospiraceae bacterium]|nr:glucose 1-dehydrogenase [Saprospiraceae bacterium]
MEKKFSLEGKRAIVTGAGSGIGEAIGVNFAQAGAFVYLLDINDSTGVADRIRQSGGAATFCACDVSIQQEVDATMATIRSDGPIDILVNNAGIAHIGSASETDPKAFDQVLQVNVYGVYHCLHAVLPYMQKDGGGVILNIASTLSSVAIPRRFAYGASKGAVLTMTYSVALDYIEDHIRCNAISPGRVHTAFVDGYIAKNYPGREQEMLHKLSSDHPIGRMAQPSEIADLALFLCSDESAFITGSNHPIDGGFTKLVKPG